MAWKWDILDRPGGFVGMYLHIMYTLPRYCHPRRLARLSGEQRRSLCISQSGIVGSAAAASEADQTAMYSADVSINFDIP